jgi:hypothetical protein
LFYVTYAGNMYAWEAQSAPRNGCSKRGAIGHSPAQPAKALLRLDGSPAPCGGGHDRKEIWNYECEEGIRTSPVVFRRLVVFPDGVLNALHSRDGRLAWNFKQAIASPTSASVSETERVISHRKTAVYCPTRAMARCLNLEAPRFECVIIFRSLHAARFSSTNPVKDFHTILTQQEQMLEPHGLPREGHAHIWNERGCRAGQVAIVEFLRKNWRSRPLRVHVVDGKEPWILRPFFTPAVCTIHPRRL